MTVVASTRVRREVNRMPLDESYLVWLYSQVGEVKNRNRSKTYWKLLRLLYMKEFTWSIDKDENRAQDGKDLRRKFLQQTDTVVDEPGWMDLPCSVLEMLIALSWRLAWDGGGELQEWFWIMIDNLDLIECTDARPPNKNVVDVIFDRVIYRRYADDGEGGLFPLRHPDQNQRDVEILYQAQAYLLENMERL
jgi:hypothetical protein